MADKTAAADKADKADTHEQKIPKVFRFAKPVKNPKDIEVIALRFRPRWQHYEKTGEHWSCKHAENGAIQTPFCGYCSRAVKCEEIRELRASDATSDWLLFDGLHKDYGGPCIIMYQEKAEVKKPVLSAEGFMDMSVWAKFLSDYVNEGREILGEEAGVTVVQVKVNRCEMPD